MPQGFVTLGEAARQTGRSKSQISRAIRDGKLSAERSVETGSFKIEQSELQRTHTGKAAGLSQARERWRVYDVAREVQAAC